MPCLYLGGGNETTRFHHISCWVCRRLAACGACAARFTHFPYCRSVSALRQRERTIPRHRDRGALSSCQGGAIESVADFTYYCQQRAAEDFNCIQLDLICTGYVGDPDATNYTTRDGIAPFTGAKVTTPNPTYFARMVQLVQIMQQNGLAAWLNPYETSAGGTGQLISIMPGRRLAIPMGSTSPICS
jgi:hypothetical protein